MKTLAASLLAALAFALPATSTTGPVQSANITGSIPVTIYAHGLTPGASYTPEWKVFRSDTDTTPDTYFRSAIIADSSGAITTSIPLQILSDYGTYIPYDIEMSLLQPDAQGFLQPVYDIQGREYCIRVPVWEYASSESCTS